ncbi:hypothetical protein Tco_1029860 [Tanacetum coccineum]|uniref:Retrovirus-related Pol polyprotein from transposon TNT 1-94 n=1 Tax=Tanacetum coccineum TaxID=301880 RepID=A0ABQ5G574_9ASTR
MVPPNNLGPDLNGKYVNETRFKDMIGSLMYLTASRLDIQFSTCLCARYQANPKESHLIAVKRIFIYLKGYSDFDYARCNMDRKSTSGACQLLGGKLVCWSAKKQQYVVVSSAEAEYVVAAGCYANILWMKSQLTDYDIIYEKGEKNIIPVIEDAELANLVDLICIDVVEEYHKNKLLYNKYCDKMLKIKKSPKIKNCEVLINKGPITLKIYREDRSEEVILNLKVNDLHVAEWREVIQACPDKSEKGWKTIYALVKTRLD